MKVYFARNPADQKHAALIDEPITLGLDDPKGYRVSADAADAVNTAIALGRPLLITGESGVGKTQLAHAIADRLQAGDPDLQQDGRHRAIKCVAKSSSSASDFFYIFRHVDRLFDHQVAAREAGTGPRRDDYDYLNFIGLGKAIVLAAEAGMQATPLAAGGAPVRFDRLLPPALFDSPGAQKRRVVLVDEIDKAPRDVLNDMLDEIEQMSFDVPEVGLRIAAPREMRPIVIMTSNDERPIPSPFLRRCVFLHMQLPRSVHATDPPFDPEREVSLEEILVGRLAGIDAGSPLLRDAVEVFGVLRRERLHKAPSISELLDWVLTLKQPDNSFAESALSDARVLPIATNLLGLMLKHNDDLALGRNALADWAANKE